MGNSKLAAELSCMAGSGMLGRTAGMLFGTCATTGIAGGPGVIWGCCDGGVPPVAPRLRLADVIWVGCNGVVPPVAPRLRLAAVLVGVPWYAGGGVNVLKRSSRPAGASGRLSKI